MGLFQRRNVLAAIEIGTSKICVLFGEYNDDGDVQVIGHGEEKVTDCVVKGEIVDMDATLDALDAAVRHAEDQSDVNLIHTIVYVSVTGNHISSQESSGLIYITNDDHRISEDHILEAINNSHQCQLDPKNSVITYLDSHFRIDKARKLLNPCGMVAQTLEAFVHVIYGDTNRIRNFSSIIGELSYEENVEIVLSPVASVFGSLDTIEKEDGVLLIEMGAGITEYIVLRDSGYKLCGVVPVGCNHIINDIAIGLEISFSTASDLLIAGEYDSYKRNDKPFIDLKSSIQSVNRKLPITSINKIIDVRIRELAQIIFKEVEKADLIQSLSMGVVLSGGGALIPASPELFNSEFGTPVRVAKPSGIIELDDLNSPRYSTVCGLLILGLQMTHAKKESEKTGIINYCLRAVDSITSDISQVFSDIKNSFLS